jgi:hypothetical protein
MSVLIHKSGAKAESLQTKKSSLKTECQLTSGMDSKNGIMVDAQNCKKRYVTADP